MSVSEQRVREILGGAVTDGRQLRILEHLDRHEYLAVDAVLRNQGGQWNRAQQAHLFADDAATALATVLAGGQLPSPPRTAEGYAATPPELARRVVDEHTHIAALPAGARVLEPSAGDGQLVRAVLRANPQAHIIAVEPNADRAAPLAELTAELHTTSIEDFAAATPAGSVDAVVMNPPFALPGARTAWIDHLHAAWRLLAAGGRLAAIAPAGYLFRTDRRHRGARELIERADGGCRHLEDDALGNGVHAVILWADKPTDPHHPEPDAPAPLPRPATRRSRRTYTPAQRDQVRATDLALRQSANALLGDPDQAARLAAYMSSDAVTDRVRSYSSRNQALLLTQCDHRNMALSDVDSLRGWRSRGRRVRRGERGLRIVAPRGQHHGDSSSEQNHDATETEPADTDTCNLEQAETTATRTRFRMVSVFEHSQTQEAA